eukprot:CAMPEP_0195015294 /NCGR_PEP_ID=MMETSP0326_2-20130528/18973_1 /TAXON_ID=2866 ORGANISM="Crypthecodinium cohnii, Strain Seligo" /NCGR_SAMPLE_ID=MMETSP0326_2 /ASSEMBLY_ACC=CAM_ASM_000348 /LENGTH=32 /DNA_ID= /DNA_START= /DNA_END= /DNA_ORIENTATION=
MGTSTAKAMSEVWLRANKKEHNAATWLSVVVA